MQEAKLHHVHPGEVLLEEFLKPMTLSQNRLALDIGVHPRGASTRLCSGSGASPRIPHSGWPVTLAPQRSSGLGCKPITTSTWRWTRWGTGWRGKSRPTPQWVRGGAAANQALQRTGGERGGVHVDGRPNIVGRFARPPLNFGRSGLYVGRYRGPEGAGGHSLTCQAATTSHPDL